MTTGTAKLYTDNALNFRDRARYWQGEARGLRRAADILRAQDRYEAGEVAITTARTFDEIAAREFKQHAIGVISEATEALNFGEGEAVIPSAAVRISEGLREVLGWLRTGATPSL